MTLPLPSFTRFLVRFVSLLLLLGASLLTQGQTIRYVKPAATGTGNGSSWANASGNLQAMITASAATDQVWVAAGTYKPTTTTDRTISFAMKNGVAIYGGFVGNETALSARPAVNPITDPGGASQPSSTTLSGDIGMVGNNADNSYHVIYNLTILATNAVLDGFVITGGKADGANLPSNSGGGMYNNGFGPGKNCSSLVRNCLFQNNSATEDGAALFNDGSFSGRSNPTLSNCSFQDNSAADRGGAVYSKAIVGTATSNPTLTNCVLFGNGGSNTLVKENSANFPESFSSFVATYSLFENTVVGYSGGNNLTTTISPFISATDLRLNACAPAINTGTNSPSELSGITIDLGGNARLYNNGIVDMGAYEYQGNPTTIMITNPATVTATQGGAFSQAFTASGGTSPYSYSVASGSPPPGLILANTGVLSGSPTQAGSFTITVLGRDVIGCSGTSAPYTLTVINATPTIAGFAADPASVCVGSPLTFTATVGNLTGSGAYTLTNGSSVRTGTLASSAFQETLTSSGTGEQSFTLTVSSSGQRAMTTTLVTVNALPVATLTNDGPLSCTMISVTLTAGGGGSYRFSNGTNQINGGNTATVNTAGTYSVTVTNGSGYTATASTRVDENKTPPTASFTNNGPLSAAMSSVTLTAAPGGVAYAFSLGATQQGGSSGNTATVTTLGTYSVIITGANGCTATAATTTATPIGHQTVCRNSRLVLTTTRPAARYEWYKNGQTAANKLIDVASIQVGTTTASLTLVSVQTSASYYVKEIQAGGSFSWSGPFTITVDGRCTARMGLDEPGLTLSVQVAPSPVAGGQLQASVTGPQGGPLTVQLVDTRGYVVQEQHWEQAAPTEVVSWDVSPQPAGVYILQALTKQQRQTSKVLKL